MLFMKAISLRVIALLPLNAIAILVKACVIARHIRRLHLRLVQAILDRVVTLVERVDRWLGRNIHGSSLRWVHFSFSRMSFIRDSGGANLTTIDIIIFWLWLGPQRAVAWLARHSCLSKLVLFYLLLDGLHVRTRTRRYAEPSIVPGIVTLGFQFH